MNLASLLTVDKLNQLSSEITVAMAIDGFVDAEEKELIITTDDQVDNKDIKWLEERFQPKKIVMQGAEYSHGKEGMLVIRLVYPMALLGGD